MWSDPAGKLLGKCDREKGKPSKTIITILAQNSDSTLVKCKPVTGRTHQIRLHLQFLGFPIIGDPLYQLQNEDIENDQYLLMQRSNPKHQTELETDESQSSNSPACVYEKDSICSKCIAPIPDLPISSMYMCLHSAWYSGDGWSFFAAPPFWAEALMSPSDIRDCLLAEEQN